MKTFKLVLIVTCLCIGMASCTEKSAIACFTAPERAKQLDKVSFDAGCSEKVKKYGWNIVGTNTSGADLVSGQNDAVSVWSFNQPGDYTMSLQVSVGAPGVGESITKKITIYQ